jgi:hypothetical protein
MDTSFDFIDLGDDIIAAVDAAVSARQASQLEVPSFSCTSSHLSTTQQGIIPPISSSNINTIHTFSSSENLVTHTTNHIQQHHHPNLTIIDDGYGEFPDIDFDAVDQLVAKRGDNFHATLGDTTKPAPMVTPTTHHSNEPASIAFTRYVICSVTEDNTSFQKILGVQLWSGQNEHHKRLGYHHENRFSHVQQDNDMHSHQLQPEGFIVLQGEWYHAPCIIGDIIHICSLSGRYPTGPWAFPITLTTQSGTADENDLVLVLHPDLLVTPTAISETIHCNRRAVLMSRLASSGGFTCKYPCLYSFSPQFIHIYTCHSFLYSLLLKQKQP